MNVQIGRERRGRSLESEQREVVDSILREKVMTVDAETFRVRYLLDYGSKTLELYYDRVNDEFSTGIAANSGGMRKAEETTLLYAAARQIMLSVTPKMHRPSMYTLRTEDEKILAWARTKGDTLFHWDGIVEHHDQGDRTVYEFVTLIVPSSSLERRAA